MLQTCNALTSDKPQRVFSYMIYFIMVSNKDHLSIFEKMPDFKCRKKENIPVLWPNGLEKKLL